MNVKQDMLVFARLLVIVLATVSLLSCNRPQTDEEMDRATQPQANQAKVAEWGTGLLSKCVDAKAGGPEDLMRKLYGKNGDAPKRGTYGGVVVELSKFFDEDLAKWLMNGKTLDCSFGGVADACDVSGLLAVGDDNQMKEFRVCAMDERKHTVSVRFLYDGKPMEYTFTLVQRPEGWRISAISHVGVTYDGKPTN